MKTKTMILGALMILFALVGCQKEQETITEITTEEDFNGFDPTWRLKGYIISQDTFMGSGFAYVDMIQHNFVFRNGIVPFGLIGKYERRNYPIAKIERSEAGIYKVTLKSAIEYNGGKMQVIFFNEYTIKATTSNDYWKAWTKDHKYYVLPNF